MSEIEVSLDDSSPEPANDTSKTADNTSSVADKSPARTPEPAQHTPVTKPAGYDAVDVRNASPEQIEERLNYLYSQVKTNEREKKEGNRTLTQYRKIAEEQSRQIEELTRSQSMVINHLQDKNIVDNETQLNEIMRQAFERGDNKTYNDAQNRLIEIKVEKKALADKRQVQPQPQRQQNVPQNNYNSASDISNRAVESGELSESDARITQAWQDEKDQNGQNLRPWAYDTHPMFRQALIEGQAVFNNPRFANLPYDQKLAEIDRRMGVEKPNAGQNVIGGGLQSPKKTTKINLTPEVERMVIRTKWGDTKKKQFKSDDERLAAYAKQIATVRNSKSGVRR